MLLTLLLVMMVGPVKERAKAMDYLGLFGRLVPRLNRKHPALFIEQDRVDLYPEKWTHCVPFL